MEYNIICKDTGASVMTVKTNTMEEARYLIQTIMKHPERYIIEPITAKDIEVQETLETAKELDVTPSEELCPKCKWLMGACICSQKVEETKLWKFNRITGYWKIERTMLIENAAQYLASFQELYPKDYFKVSKRKPKGLPY